MKKLLGMSLMKPTEHQKDHEGSPPTRAASLPIRPLLPPSPNHSVFSENPAETPRSHRPVKPCTNEQCQAFQARLQHQLENLKEEKSQLESLIQMQQQTLRRIDQEGRNSEELAARQLKVKNKLALVLQDEKASMEDKLKSSADAIHSLNEQVTTLRQLLAARNAEAEKMFTELHELREADIKARDASKEDAVRLAEANAELQNLRKRVAELEEKAMKAEPLMRLGSPEKLASLVTKNLTSELAAKEESMSCLKQQLSETQAHAEEAVKEKDAELKSLRERFAELEEQATKAASLMRLGSPEKLATLVTRNTELVDELAEKEESMARLKRELSETQAHAEESAKEKNEEMQSLRERLSDLEEQVKKAEPLMRLGSPEKLASLMTRNTELVSELAEKEENVSSLKRQLTETQVHAEEAAKEKDAELQSLRDRLADLEQQATKAEELLRLGSPGKLASLVTRNTELVGELAEQEEGVSSLKRQLTETQKHAEEAIQEKDAELQSLRSRLADLEEQAAKAEPLMRLGSPEKLASLVTRNTELLGELAEKEENVSSLKRQLTETQVHAEEAAKEKDAELQSLRDRLADLEQQATKAEELLRLGSPGKLASLVTRNTELVGELAEQEEGVSSLKRQLTETQKHAEEAIQEKDAELQSLRSRLADLEEQATKAEPLMRLGSPEKLASLVTRNTELVGELAEKDESVSSLKRQLTETQVHAEEAVKEKDAELQSLRDRLADLEQQATKADELLRLGSPGKLASLVTRNTELVGELAEQEEGVSSLKRQLTETQKHAEEAIQEKDAELQSLRSRLADLEEQATKAEPLMRLGSPEKLASLVTRNMELVGELAEKEESVLSLKRQLTETQCQAEEAAKEKDGEIQTLRDRVAQLEEQATKAESLMRLGSPEKLASLVTRNTELVGELAEKEESVSSLKRQLTQTQAHAEEATREKDAELHSLRNRLALLEEQATNADPPRPLGSRQKTDLLETQNTELAGEVATDEESVSSLKRQLMETRAHAEEALKEKDEELKSLKKRLAEFERQATKAEQRMHFTSRQQSASSKTRSLETFNGMKQDEEHVGVSKRQSFEAPRSAVASEALTLRGRQLRETSEGEHQHALQEQQLEQEKSDQAQHVTQEEESDNARLLREAHEMEQRLQRQLQHMQDKDVKEDCSNRKLCTSSPAEGLKDIVEMEVSTALACPAVAVTSPISRTVLKRDLADKNSSDVIRLLRMFDSHDAKDGLLKASCSIF
ncbi:hypothetical protein Emed_001416 [Eimeria media]